MLWALIVAAIVGLFTGALARLALPGKDPLSLLQTMLVGIAGSVIATLIVALITGGTYGAGWFLGFCCSVAIMYLIRRRRGGGLLDPGVAGPTLMTAARSVLITGCSTGIGRATALRLVAAGWTVYATARKPETLAELEAAGCRVMALDVTDEASMEAAVAAVERPLGALVNNAGYSLSGALETLPMEAVRRQFETNVFGLLRLTQLVLPQMREAGAGRIVNLSSMGGRLTFPGGGAYHATKYAVEALSDALRVEVAPFGIDVIVVEPGLIKSEFGETAASQVGDGGPYAAFNVSVAKATREVYTGPAARLGGDPDDVAGAIERALERRRAPTRVPVTASARLLMGLHAVLPDRVWDRAVKGSFDL